VDNDGNALVAGALYFNTTTNEMKVYDGTQWLSAYASLSGALLATNNLSDLNNVATARTNLGLGTAATTNASSYVAVTGDQTVAGIKTFSSNPVLSGGTANGVLYLNGSKVATSGSALTFDGTTVANINSDGTGFSTQNAASNFSILRLGTDSVNGYAFFQSGKSGTGTTLPFSWRQDSSELMRLTSTGLGIGTSSPSYKLDVYGATGVVSRFKSSGNYAVVVADNSNTTGGGSFSARQNGTSYAIFGVSGAIQGDTSTDAAILADGAGKGINFYTNGSPTVKATLDSSGNLGLGVTPSAWNTLTTMQIKNASFSGYGNHSYTMANTFYQTGWKYIASEYALQYYQNATAGSHVWYNAASGTAGNAITFTQAMTLDASGSLGIGVTSVPEALTVKPNGTGANLGLNLVNNASNLSGVLFSTNAAPATSYTYIKGDGRSSGFITLSTNDTERMRIDSSGNVLVGTTSVNFTGSGLTLSSNAGTTKWLVGPYSGASGQFYVCSSSSTGVYLSSTSATSWSSNSDFNLKTDLVAIENAAEKVASLRAVTGRYKTDPEGTSRAFLIAQDVQAVLPEAVAPTTMYDGTEVLGLAYTEVIPLLVAAIKEQQAIIEQLTSRIAALETKGA
jgi:hypothetical protein